MNKREPVLQPVDLTVAAGAVATVLGALLIVLSTNGSFDPAVPPDAVNLDANQWVQPALGQTLVEIAALERSVPRRPPRLLTNSLKQPGRFKHSAGQTRESRILPSKSNKSGLRRPRAPSL